MENSHRGDGAPGGTPQLTERSGHGTAGRTQLAASLAPLAAGLLAIVAVIGLIGFAFRSPQPHDLPVGLVGPPAVVHQVSAEFGAGAPGAFEFTSYASQATARAALDGRDVDAVLTVGPGRPELVVAGAAGSAIAGVITSAVGGAFRAQGTPLTVQTVHPFAPGDPQGLLLFFAVLAVLVASLLAGALIGLGPSTGWRARLAILAAYGLVAGPVAMSMEAWAAASFGSGFWSAAGVLALAAAAVATATAGLARLLGAPGVALAAFVLVLLDLISSGGPIGTPMLPAFYRWLAPGMPAGQLYSALRGALFFNDASLAVPFLVLAAWLAGGLALLSLAGSIRPARGPRPSQTPSAPA
jgi:hypothetical protein